MLCVARKPHTNAAGMGGDTRLVAAVDSPGVRRAVASAVSCPARESDQGHRWAFSVSAFSPLVVRTRLTGCA